MNCEKCGNPIADNVSSCESCGHEVAPQDIPTQQYDQAYQYGMEGQEEAAPPKKPENVLTGTVGALIGAAIGAGAIILLSQLGYVAAISGLILAVCTLKGYELLGGRLSIKGIIISIVLMLITPYIADRLDWAIVIMNSYSDMGVTFGQAFSAIPALIQEGAIELSDYITNLVMLYVFAAIGAFGTLLSLFKKNRAAK